MTLQDKCTSLELSKRLKELGVPQVSEFYWTTDSHPYGSGKFEDDGTASISYGEIEADNIYSAFISDELLKVIPEHLEENGETYNFLMGKDFCGYYNGEDETWGFSKDGGTTTDELFFQYNNGENAAEFLGLLVEYLIINGYLDPKEIKL